MIECEPAARVVVAKVALLALMVPVPRVVVPSLNVTVPVAAAGVIVAVKVTDAPNVDGFNDEANAVVEVALFTVCVSAEDVLVLKLLLPP